uniref:KASH domain-containing protein n=1 Tax=Setaria digitata TaxID=48799 RepID=A0A915PLF1_9BILA
MKRAKVDRLRHLRAKVLHLDTSCLDVEFIGQKELLLSSVDELLQRLEKYYAYLDEKLSQLLIQEKMSSECTMLCDELKNLLEYGQQLLNDSEALPTSFSSVSDSMTVPIEAAVKLLSNEVELEQIPETVINQLRESLEKSKDVQTRLTHRADLWDQFVAERDSSLGKLNDIRMQLDEIERRKMRQFDEMLEDCETLKVIYLRWSFLADLSSRLLSLSSQLYPLACARREGKAFAEDANELERRIENLLDSISAEFRVREEIMRSLSVISSELDDIRNAFDGRSVSARLREELHQQLESTRIHLKTLDEDIAKYNDNRMFLTEEADITTKSNFEKLGEIEEKLKLVGLTDNEEEYDIDAAAEVLAAVYPDEHPRNVLREQGIPFDNDLYDLTSSSATTDDDDNSKFKTPPSDEVLVQEDEEDAFETHLSPDVAALSPVPDDPSPRRIHYERQRTRWRRVLRTAIPLQAMLVLLLGAACLVPHCDDESCCQLLNNFARSFDPSLEFLNGPPPF